ncbi:hypothetical protein JKY72_07110 [Candidatus Gracilibacteria bacterium]|nr:hypothetical protein [Candidatus Gracilibacteria bacterium]
MGFLDFIAPGKKQNQAQAGKSTQNHLRIGEVRDDVLVLKNGGVRAVLKTSSINFNLKSEDEQKAIISSYQGFLNSLEFPIQILVRSKKLDIDDYINSINETAEKQENKLLQEQTYEYAEYIQKLIEYADIMEKEFYVVVPYDPIRSRGSEKGIAGFQSFFGRLSPKESFSDLNRRKNEFEELKKNLMGRVSTISAGLESCGLKVSQLNTEEIIKVMYRTYNPLSSKSAKLGDLENSDLKLDKETGI